MKVSRVVAQTLRHPDNVAAALAFAGTALRKFFWLQFTVKLRITRIPVVNVDHALDATIPFAPEHVDTYLDFIAFWIRPLGLIGERFGRAAQRRYTKEYLRLIRRCYQEAADVYADTMTTTRRPAYRRGKFLTIYLFDPHYLCVPSLHVMIVVLTETFIRRAFQELGASPDDVAAIHAELFEGAVAITEAVLYIKQHSVNCLPAALYGISRITPEDVSEGDVAAFVDALFATASDVSDDDAAAIRSHIHSVFARLSEDGAADGAWTPAVRRFVARFR